MVQGMCQMAGCGDGSGYVSDGRLWRWFRVFVRWMFVELVQGKVKIAGFGDDLGVRLVVSEHEY